MDWAGTLTSYPGQLLCQGWSGVMGVKLNLGYWLQGMNGWGVVVVCLLQWLA